MTRLHIVLLTALLLTFTNASATETASLQKNLGGSSWVNEYGSVFTVTSVSSSGQITGNYVNNARGFGCQGTEYPVTGWVLENAISFTVIWNNATENCHSVTGWTGYYANNAITTNWNLATNTSISTGKDTFTPSTIINSK